MTFGGGGSRADTPRGVGGGARPHVPDRVRALRTASRALAWYNADMPKLTSDYPTPLNILVTPAMKQTLIAVSFHQGRRGAFGAAARDMIQAGIDKYLASLGPADRKRFDEVMQNVKISSQYKQDLK